MGLLDALFGKKPQSNNISATVTSSEPKQPVKNSRNATLHLRGVADAEGLYPSELVMLNVAESYKTNDTDFPKYLTYTYEVTNPLKTIKDLEQRGYITIGSAVDSLSNYKLPELKEIATSVGVSTSGKKADIMARLAEAGEDKIQAYVKDRSWKLTDKGQTEVEANPYIGFFLENHKHSLSEIGIDIWTVNASVLSKPNHGYRDVIMNQIKDRMEEAKKEMIQHPNSGSANPHFYCSCFRMMALFLEEDMHFTEALDTYFQYIFKNINVLAGDQLKRGYELFKSDKTRQKDMINRFYDDVMLYPFQRDDIRRLIDESEIASENVRESMVASFVSTGDKGVMDAKTAADFVILELSGETDKSKDMALKIAKIAVS